MIGFSNITVYRFPERVELAPLPPWQPVGRPLILRCMVSGGAPRDHLTVVLLREENELGRQPAGKGEPAEVTVTVLATRDDHGANFSCRTELDLQSQGLGLFQNSSAPRKLRTFGRNPIAITIVLGVLTILGLVILPAALVYVFGVQKRRDIYHVRQSSTQL
uniref:Intercellular adhesion molecule 3 n=1 Tax=Balaenoptera musculus TaxID=9771 RepID=A0A8C0D9S0_BALMU